MSKQLFIPLLAFCFINKVRAQQPVTDSLTYQDAGVVQAVNVYHHTAGLQSQLYRGKEHIRYKPDMVGSAYFLSDDPQTGTIEYEGLVFTNVPMWYDEVRDKVVVQHFNEINVFELESERVSRFTIGDHSFIRIVKEGDNNPLSAGFYEVLCSGSISILAKRIKLVTEIIENMEVKTRIDLKEYYYGKKEGVYYSIKNQRTFLNIVKDKRKEVQQYINSNKLKFRKNFEKSLTAAALYYNQLTH